MSRITFGTGKIHNTCQKLQYCSHVHGNGVQVPYSVASKRRTHLVECCMELIVVLGVMVNLLGFERASSIHFMARVIPFLTELTQIYGGNINSFQNKNKQVRQCIITQRWDAFVQPLLQWKAITVTYSDSVFVA